MRIDTSAERDRASTISRSTLLYALALAGVFVLAALLRVYNFNVRPLWNDEGFTVLYTRMSWADVLGLHGYYDIHPPLYYALVKLVGLLASEKLAGRLLSVVAGTLTI